jgi:hypothetical protein
MKVKDFSGREYNFPCKGSMPDLDDQRERSELHLETRKILKSLYPTQRILEEVPLPGINLYADFYLPHSQTLIEVHGRQHYEFVAYFHGNRLGFARGQRNDIVKQDWCILNNIKLVILPYDKRNNWKDIIESA